MDSMFEVGWGRNNWLVRLVIVDVFERVVFVVVKRVVVVVELLMSRIVDLLLLGCCSRVIELLLLSIDVVDISFCR